MQARFRAITDIDSKSYVSNKYELLTDRECEKIIDVAFHF